MTPRTHNVYVCASCGAQSPKWLGKCHECGEWNTFAEEAVRKPSKSKVVKAAPGKKAVALAEIESSEVSRFLTSMPELDRVLGGGLVPGSVVLLAGDPGIGKSTLMLQMLSSLSESGAGDLIYCTGEESAQQVRMRADRLGLDGSRLFLLTENNVETISGNLNGRDGAVLVVDSIQTAYTEALESFPGSFSQVRETAGMLLKMAKTSGNSVFIVGHITKEGSIAGPKMLEHSVDTVLYMEGDRRHAYRILRTVKNRFGSTDEIGVFEMTEKGLRQVENPSEFFLSGREAQVSGSVVVVSMEGSRPLLLEIQALVSRTAYGVPQRNTTGLDSRRISMLIAVLEKRAGHKLGTQDVFVNVVGGLRIAETSVDLGAAVAMASSFMDEPVDVDTVVIGEVGLAGEVRPVSFISRRLKEAYDLGFRRAVLPKSNKVDKSLSRKMRLTQVSTLSEALSGLL